MVRSAWNNDAVWVWVKPSLSLDSTLQMFNEDFSVVIWVKNRRGWLTLIDKIEKLFGIIVLTGFWGFGVLKW